VGTPAGVPETARLARTVTRWQAEILASNATGGASNGPTEAVNLLIKLVRGCWTPLEMTMAGL
jgi:transposase